ncbi:MAG: type IV toxin-antitoxin system AbiEi family antitoxin domain-containing protein [Myxococcota bacterium]
MATSPKSAPETGWDDLYELAEGQSGHFSAQQADEIGFYPQRLQKYLLSKRIERVRRGIYRLTHFPPSEHEELVVYWLWTECAGVYSGETALNLHELSDALPAQQHLTLPESWASRRLRAPTGIVLHFADILDTDRSWVGPVPVTKPKRTVEDCIELHVQPDLVEQAIAQAKDRGLVTRATATKLSKMASGKA